MTDYLDVSSSRHDTQPQFMQNLGFGINDLSSEFFSLHDLLDLATTDRVGG